MSITYRSAVPENNKDAYVEFDIVDFLMSFPNEKVMLNTIRIEGECEFLQANGDVVTRNVLLDKLVGAHSFFQTIQTFVNGQSIDNIIEYPRMVKTMTAASVNPNDMNNAANACELKAANDAAAVIYTKQEAIKVVNGAPADERLFDIDFAIKPLISLNRNVSASSTALSYSQTGDIRISVQCARNQNVMYGIGNNDTNYYQLKNLRLTYMTYPDDGVKEKVLLEKTVSVQQSFFGQVAQLNMNAPIVAQSTFGSFIKQDDQAKAVKNNLKLEKPPLPKNVKFMWNSSTNEYISYELRSETEIIDHFLDAISFSGKNSTSLTAIAANDGWGVGMRMNDSVDMMNNVLTLRLESAVSDNTNYLLTMYFNGLEAL